MSQRLRENQTINVIKIAMKYIQSYNIACYKYVYKYFVSNVLILKIKWINIICSKLCR